jgi:hypothetical protein
MKTERRNFSEKFQRLNLLRIRASEGTASSHDASVSWAPERTAQHQHHHRRRIFSKRSMVMQFFGVLLLGSHLIAANGSIYSRFGVGDIATFISSRSAAMGGTGIALLTDGYINRANPAALGRISRTQYSADFQYQGFAMDDGTASSFLSSANFQGAMLAFPLYSEYNIAFAFGITPFSHTAYDVRDEQIQAGQNIIQTFDGVGGLSSAQFGFSFSPRQDLFLGVTTQYLFGKFNDRQRLQFADNTGYFVSDVERDVSMDGFAFTFGGLYAGIDKALGFSAMKNLNVAATIFSGAALSAKEEKFQNYTTTQETTDVQSGVVKIPLGVTFGAAYLLQEKLILTSDLQIQNWDTYKYFGTHPLEIRNSTRFGVGAELLPTLIPGDPYYQQMTYRVGAYVNSSYLKVNGQGINEYFVTGGVGLPVFFSPNSEARMNLSLEYGIRGTRASGLQKDSITRLTISLSGSDTWFIPQEIE